jgi:hypothetical protein
MNMFKIMLSKKAKKLTNIKISVALVHRVLLFYRLLSSVN